MKTIITTLLLIIYLNVNAQSAINVSAGYKAIELGYTYTDEETELIYGVSASVVDSKVSEHRANVNDKGKMHNFKGDLVPATFLLIGSKFERLNIIGKFGGAKVEQTINGREEPKNIYLALGIIGQYHISDRFGLSIGYDSANAFLSGLTIKL